MHRKYLSAIFLGLFVFTTDAQTREVGPYRCDEPKGKRVEYGTVLKLDGTPLQRFEDGPKWDDDGFSGVRPVVLIDETEMIVSWGNAVPKNLRDLVGDQSKVYRLPIIGRGRESVFSMRAQASTIEIFRFYFGDNILYRLTSSLSFGGAAPYAPSMAAIYVTHCERM